MCTGLSLKNKEMAVFGRNLDIEINYGQQVVITPRGFEWPMRFLPKMKQKYAMIGMALPFKDPANGGVDYPLYFDGANEEGLACSSLNFPGIAYYPEPGSTKATKGELVEITPFEFIQWICANFKTTKEVKEFFEKNTVAFVNKPIAEQFPLSPLHFIVSDKKGEAITLESSKEGLKMFENPVGILTNNPTFDWQMYNLSNYQNLVAEQSYDVKWGDYNLKPFGQGFGAMGLPGDCTPPSRFVRAAFHKFTSNLGQTLEDLITQYFHIMDSVAMVKGSIIVRNQQDKTKVHDDITLYTSCIDLNNLVYYYKTYGNNRISAVDMKAEGTKLDGNQIMIYPFLEKQDFNWLNK